MISVINNRRNVWVITAAALAAAVMWLGYFQPTQASKPASVEHRVEISEFEFVPATLSVRPGDTITWINRDLVPHTATAKDNSWDTARRNQGETASLPVKRDMVTDYYCRFHPAMTARLKIVIAD